MFRPYSHDNGLQPWEYLEAAAGTYKSGQALQVTNGHLAPVTEALQTTPAYICMADVTVDAGKELPVIRVTDKVVFETALSAAAAGAKVGSLLEVSAGGLAVDATAAGTFDVNYIEGTEAGSVVRGRFK